MKNLEFLCEIFQTQPDLTQAAKKITLADLTVSKRLALTHHYLFHP